MKKIIFLVLVLLLLVPIYFSSIDHKINYISLGDSLAAGVDPYQSIGLGCSDYVENYLKKNKLLKFYTKDFAKSGHTIQDLKTDINNNIQVKTGNKTLTIQQALNEADLITLSIGANDIFQKMGLNDMSFNFEKIDDTYRVIDEIAKELDTLMKLIKRYNDKHLILIGYYNPLSALSDIYDVRMEPLFIYLNNKYRTIAEDNQVIYIDIYYAFKQNSDFLPNPMDIHPSSEGYKFIADKIIGEIEDHVIK